jgi:hypothetical protein
VTKRKRQPEQLARPCAGVRAASVRMPDLAFTRAPRVKRRGRNSHRVVSVVAW